MSSEEAADAPKGGAAEERKEEGGKSEGGDAPAVEKESEGESKKRRAEDDAGQDEGKRPKEDPNSKPEAAPATAASAPIPPPPAIPTYGGGYDAYGNGDLGGGGGGGGGGGVQALLESCYATGICRQGELDMRVLESLRNLSEAEGASAMAEFMKADMSRVRNKSAYLSGVISRIKDDRLGGGGGGGRPRGGGGGGYDSYGGGGGGANMNMSGYNQAALAPQYNAFSGLADAYGGGAMTAYGGGGAMAAMAPMGNAYGGGMQSLSAPNYAVLTPTVNATMEQLFLRGTVQRWEIDQKCVDGLRALPEHLAIEAIQDFSCRDLLQIRNKSAYFMGCINKRKENMQMAQGLPTGTGEAANSPQVRARLEEMFASGIMPRETLDYRAWSEFSKLREVDAMSALDEFMSSDQTRIRNKAAYFMGICKKRAY